MKKTQPKPSDPSFGPWSWRCELKRLSSDAVGASRHHQDALSAKCTTHRFNSGRLLAPEANNIPNSILYDVPDVFYDVSVNWRPGLSPYPLSTLAPCDPSRQCFLDKGMRFDGTGPYVSPLQNPAKLTQSHTLLMRLFPAVASAGLAMSQAGIYSKVYAARQIIIRENDLASVVQTSGPLRRLLRNLNAYLIAPMLAAPDPDLWLSASQNADSLVSGPLLGRHNENKSGHTPFSPPTISIPMSSTSKQRQYSLTIAQRWALTLSKAFISVISPTFVSVALWPAAKRLRVSASKRGLPRLGELEAPPARVSSANGFHSSIASCYKLEELRETVMKLPVRLSIGESVIIHQGQGSVRLVVDTLVISLPLYDIPLTLSLYSMSIEDQLPPTTYPETLQNVSYEREALRSVQVVVDNNTDEVQNAARASPRFRGTRDQARIAQEHEGVRDTRGSIADVNDQGPRPRAESPCIPTFRGVLLQKWHGHCLERWPSAGYLGGCIYKALLGFSVHTRRSELLRYEYSSIDASEYESMEWAYDVVYEAVGKFNCFPTTIHPPMSTTSDAKPPGNMLNQNPTAKTFAAFNVEVKELSFGDIQSFIKAS
ncbi:uncharacterized protein CLUP02_12719 [Colletotrichum lupini]|uniref:Uncharacterized protein n=1 Tax=Colletotrichum lupini TaxID=145971 RepID=A0A9Q8WLI8_9PEZI|nr:uncharacterized protein CLUP02_12719 [Colletotrichum lupini]UQC87217.1 hypothetical protein CLUP02_12719 [Colletotrichum lupini]